MNIEFEKEIAYVLKQIGINQDLKGYKYIKYATDLIMQDDKYLDFITKELYPALAEQFHTRPTAVERAIRHAVENCFNNADAKVIELMFGNSIPANKDKPTNTHFLAALVELMRFISVPDTHTDIYSAAPRNETVVRFVERMKGA